MIKITLKRNSKTFKVQKVNHTLSVAHQGRRGLKGIQGDKGDTGEQGIQGIQGEQGLTGPIGQQGPKGDTGEKGAKGNQGLQGNTGPKGEKGDQGDVGPRGIQGSTGPQGNTGQKGDQGNPGATGSTGPEGPPGDTGPAGPQGIQGDVGPGVASGGSTGQYLKKASNTNFDTSWSSLTTDEISQTSQTNKFVSAAQLTLINNSIQPGDNISDLVNDSGFVSNLSSFTTTNLAEGSNLYYTDARVQTVGDARYLRLTDITSLDTQVNFNDAGDIGGESVFTYNKTTNTLTVDNLVIAATTGNSLVIETNGLVYDATNSRVGVGTASPAATFSVGSGSTMQVGSTGNMLNAGYLRVGSISAPNNTTAGDITCLRFSIGNGTLGVGARVGLITGTLTDTAAGATSFLSATNTFTPASNSSAEIRALNFSNTINPASGVTINIVRGGFFENRVRSDGLITEASGSNFDGFKTDSSSAATASVTTVRGVNATVYSRPSGTTTATITTANAFDTSGWIGSGAATITTARGLFINNAGTGHTISSLIGVDVDSLTRGATNIGIRIALPSGGATANYALQLSDTGGTAAGGITFGTDVQLHRSAANILSLASGDSFTITAANLITDTTTGMKIGTATTQKLGFYNATPIVQPSAYTQTYSTADKTHAALTSATLTDNTAGTASTTLEALTSGITYATDVAAIRNNFADLAASNNAIIVDLTDLKQLVNSVIDDLQTLGLVG